MGNFLSFCETVREEEWGVPVFLPQPTKLTGSLAPFPTSPRVSLYHTSPAAHSWNALQVEHGYFTVIERTIHSYLIGVRSSSLFQMLFFLFLLFLPKRTGKKKFCFLSESNMGKSLRWFYYWILSHIPRETYFYCPTSTTVRGLTTIRCWQVSSISGALPGTLCMNTKAGLYIPRQRSKYWISF